MAGEYNRSRVHIQHVALNVGKIIRHWTARRGVVPFDTLDTIYGAHANEDVRHIRRCGRYSTHRSSNWG